VLYRTLPLLFSDILQQKCICFSSFVLFMGDQAVTAKVFSEFPICQPLHNLYHSCHSSFLSHAYSNPQIILTITVTFMEKNIFEKPIKKLPAFCGIHWFTRALHWSLS
jgi:hypothetical protein